MLIEEILSPIKFVTEWTSVSLSNSWLLLFVNFSSELSLDSHILHGSSLFLVNPLRPCSHFADTCLSETVFVVDTLRVHIAMMASTTQIGTILLRSKKWSETI